MGKRKEQPWKKERKKYFAALLGGTLALTVCFAGTQTEVKAEEGIEGELHNPTVVMNECDTVYFGSYWQEDTNGDGVADQKDDKTPIRWRILSKEGNDAYVIADQVLDAKPYNEENTKVTWETCTLRAWLNEDFYNTAFTAEEQGAVIEQTLVNVDDKYKIEGGNETTDKVYLPSIEDMGKADYGFRSEDNSFGDQAKIGKVTAYAKCQRADINDEESCYWWLRLPGYHMGYSDDTYFYYASTVGWYGQVQVDVCFVDDALQGVRPALHLNLSSPFVTVAGKQEISLKSVSWDTVELGSYGGKPITWRVLEVSDGTAYLLSDRILTKKAYNDEDESITWEDSKLREWLNGEFYEDYFTQEEKNGILPYTYENADNARYNSKGYYSKGGEDTKDQITLLSLSDTVKKEYGFPAFYCCEHNARIACDKKGLNKSGRGSEWWLRSPGEYQNNASLVFGYGVVDSCGVEVDYKNGVRPAMHISLSLSLRRTGSVTADENGIRYSVEQNEPTTETVSSTTEKEAETLITEKVWDPVTTEKEAVYQTTTEQKTQQAATEQVDPQQTTTETAKPQTVATEAAKTGATTEAAETVTAPAKTSLKSVTNKASKKLIAKWKKVSGAEGYEVSIATKKNFKSGKKVKTTKKTTYTFTKLKKGKTYYVRVRAYRTSDGEKLYGTYSAVKKLKIKK